MGRAVPAISVCGDVDDMGDRRSTRAGAAPRAAGSDVGLRAPGLRQHLHDRLGQTACLARLYLEGQEAPQERLAQAFGNVGAKDGRPGGEKCRPVHRRDLRYRRDHARPSGRAVIR